MCTVVRVCPVDLKQMLRLKLVDCFSIWKALIVGRFFADMKDQLMSLRGHHRDNPVRFSLVGGQLGNSSLGNHKINSPCHGYLNSYTLSQRVILGVAVKGLLL